jgi:TolA-binding protein
LIRGLRLGLVLAVTGCITPSEKREIHGDIFDVKTRLLNVERELVDTNKEARNTGDSAAKRLAGTRSDIERLQSELARIKGDLEALKVGVSTGQMPGADPNDESSVAGKLAALTTRLEAIETAQAELLDAIQKAGVKKNASAAKHGDGDSRKADTVDELQKAFDAKRYKQVAEDAPKLTKGGRAEDRQTAQFLWAESLFKLGKMSDAALKYNEFLESKPAKKHQPLAKMRLGDCFRHLGDTETAKLYYEELIRDFPDTEEATKAKERLAEKGGGANSRG